MNMQKMTAIALCGGIVFLLAIQCANPGSGTETGNPKLSGVLYNSDGTRAAGAKVACIPRKHNPYDGSHSGGDSTTTDDTGAYKFKTMPADSYNILASTDTGFTYIDPVVVTGNANTTVPPDTLRTAGSMHGIVELEPSDDARTVFMIFMGTNMVRMPSNAAGNFAMNSLGEGKYRVRLLTTLDNYEVMDTSFVITAGRDSVLPQPIVMKYTGIPVPKNLRIEYDTMKQIVTLVWDKPTTGRTVAGYNIYRKHQDSALVLLKSDWTDTVYHDSTGIQDITYEYRVAAVDTNTTEGTRSAVVSVVIASYFVVDTSFGAHGNSQGQFDRPSDIAIASNGDVYVVDFSNNRVQVFDQSMQYKREFGGGILNRPYKVAIDTLGNAYVSASDTVYIFDTTGVLFQQVPVNSSTIYDLTLNLIQLFVLTNGDTVSSYSHTGVKIRSWQCGDFNSCDWLTVGDQNLVFVSDHTAGGEKVKVFDTLGILITSIEVQPLLSYPGSLALDTNGRLFVACGEVEKTTLKVFNLSYNLIANYKIPCRDGGEPVAIAFDSKGFVYVALNASDKIIKLRSLLP